MVGRKCHVRSSHSDNLITRNSNSSYRARNFSSSIHTTAACTHIQLNIINNQVSYHSIRINQQFRRRDHARYSGSRLPIACFQITDGYIQNRSKKIHAARTDILSKFQNNLTRHIGRCRTVYSQRENSRIAAEGTNRGHATKGVSIQFARQQQLCIFTHTTEYITKCCQKDIHFRFTETGCQQAGYECLILTRINLIQQLLTDGGSRTGYI